MVNSLMDSKTAEYLKHHTLDCKMYQDALRGLSTVMNQQNENKYLIVGGLAVQIHGMLKDKSIPKRPSDDFDIENYPNLPYKDFVIQYGENLGRYFKNKFRYGFHVRDNHFANTVHIFNNKNKEQEFALLHFNRRQPEFYARVKSEIKQEVENDKLLVSLDKLVPRAEGRIPVLKTSVIRDHKKDRIIKKLEQRLSRIESEGSHYTLQVMDDILKNNNLNYVDIDKLYNQVMSSYSQSEHGEYELKKDIYDYVIVSL